MKYPLHLPVALIVTLTLLLGLALYTAAQDNALISAEICRPVLERMWAEATTACINKPAGYVCNGGDALTVEPAGPVSNALTPLGALVEVGAVDSLRTAPIVAEIGSAGVAYLRGSDSLPYTGLLIGDVAIRDVTPPDFPAWTSFAVETSSEPSSCAVAPLNLLALQSAPGASVQIVVNSVSLLLNGTVIVQTDAASTIFIAISGQAAVLAAGQERAFLTGEQISVPHNAGDVAAVGGPPNAPVPFDPTSLQSLPVALLDRPIILPQPGYVTTQGAVNMRAEPSTNAGVILQVPPGEVLNVLGSNSDGLWFHVRRLNGESGWMLAELLSQNIGTIATVYDATPLPPQRYGELGTRGRVLAPAGVNLRLGPDVTFPALTLLNDGTLVSLLARSPYSPWVKVDASGSVGWLALITIETQAYIDALPIDFSAPAIPTPTQIPGSFGNAFPDPDLPGN